MLQKSSLEGFKIKGEVERLITTLFADDTTVWLSERDSFSDLQNILDIWCKVLGAKFNITKTIIIPIGTAKYCETVVNTQKIRRFQEEHIPGDISIAKDETPVRVLEAYVENRLDQVAIWSPILEKIEAKLDQWSKSHPTQDGCCLIISMVVGGLTQYLTRVQGMSKDIEEILRKKITSFMWSGSSSMVNNETMILPVSKGGKKVLDIKALNEAIILIKLQCYAAQGNKRPRWAKVADDLMASLVPKTHKSVNKETRLNPFLQQWKPSIKGGNSLPGMLITMNKIEEEYNVGIILL